MYSHASKRVPSLSSSLLIYSNACIYSRPSSSGKEMHVICAWTAGGSNSQGEREREETSESNSCPVFSISCSSSSSSSFPFAPSAPPFPSALFYHAHTYTYDSSSSSSSSCPAHNLLFFIREGFLRVGKGKGWLCGVCQGEFRVCFLRQLWPEVGSHF